MLRRAQYLLIALFGLWVIALICPRAGLATLVTDTISVNNPSFESADPLSSGDADTGMYNSSITGWHTTGSDGTWAPNLVSHTPPYFTPSQVPDGANVAWSNGGVISQALGINLASTGTYTLTVYVGHRNDAWPTGFPNYLIGLFTGSAFASDGTNVLVSDYVPVNQGQWKAVTITYTPTSEDPLGEPLGIFLYSAGAQVDFDKVSLTRTHEVVPIPASILLLGSGLGGLGLLRFRRKIIS